MMYRIYGKDNTMKQYKAFDYENGAFVNNLVYATIIKEHELDKAKKAIEFMNSNNPEYHFELRKIQGIKYIRG